MIYNSYKSQLRNCLYVYLKISSLVIVGHISVIWRVQQIIVIEFIKL